MSDFKKDFKRFDILKQELEQTRKKLYDLTSNKSSFCENEIVSVSMQLDELLIQEMKLRGISRKVTS